MNTRTKERGAAILEAAIVLLFFFTLLFGTIEVGRFINVYQTITNAAREAARYSVTPACVTCAGAGNLPSAAAVQAVAQTYLQAAYIQISNSNIAVNQNLTCMTSGPITTTCSSVTIAAPYQVISLSMFSMLQINLTADSVMRNETSQ